MFHAIQLNAYWYCLAIANNVHLSLAHMFEGAYATRQLHC